MVMYVYGLHNININIKFRRSVINSKWRKGGGVVAAYHS